MKKETNHNQTQKLKKQKQYNNYLKFSGLAIQMAVTIYLGHLLGEYVDEVAESGSDIYTKVITLLAVFLSIFVVIREVIKSQE